jgi:hypothetical protein
MCHTDSPRCVSFGHQGLLFDAEEAHRVMMNMAVQQERHGIQGLLEAAWAWGFDTDTWSDTLPSNRY